VARRDAPHVTVTFGFFRFAGRSRKRDLLGVNLFRGEAT
jgi:hypothetical protein